MMDYLLAFIYFAFLIMFGLALLLSVLITIIDPVNGLPDDKHRKEMLKKRRKR
jgi:hypothetical protein